MAFIYTLTDHPTRKGALLAITPRPDGYRGSFRGGSYYCQTPTEDALVAIGGTHWRGHREPDCVAYTLSPAQARDLDIILRAGFLPDPHGEGFFHPEREGEFTRQDALAIVALPKRCSRTLELDFSTAPEPEPPFLVEACDPVPHDFDRKPVGRFPSLCEAVEAAVALYRERRVPRVSCADFTLYPHGGKRWVEPGDKPVGWSLSIRSRDGYKTCAHHRAEAAGVRYASHRRGYQASNRALRAFARSWDDFCAIPAQGGGR